MRALFALLVVGSGLSWTAAGFSAAPGRWELELYSPAKINLFLRILGKREDGFHELCSLFQAIDLGDTLKVSKSEKNEFECDVEGLSDDNLVTRAFSLYQKKTGTEVRFSSRLEKSTPVEAGLGGGSSNAATALWAANELCGNLASHEDLLDWSGELGSDVTFFLGETGTAYCTGRGEIIDIVDPPLDDQRIYVVKPEMGLSTGLVFKTLADTQYSTLSDRDPTSLLQTFVDGKATPADYVNDLEPPSFHLEPNLEKIKNLLLESCPGGGMMSGSGTSIFAVVDKDDADFPSTFAQKCLDEVGVKVQVYAVNYARRSPGAWYAPR